MELTFRPRSARRAGTQLVFVELPKFGSLNANSTTDTEYRGVPRRCAFVRASVSCNTVGVDADGTLLLVVKKYDASADAAVELTTAFNVEGMTTKETTVLSTVSTLTPEQLTFAVGKPGEQGDTLVATITNNSAAIDTAPTELVVVAEFAILE